MFKVAVNIACIFVYAGFGVLFDMLPKRKKNQTLTG